MGFIHIVELTAFLIALGLAAHLGVAKRLLHGLFLGSGSDVFVIVSQGGKTVVYKNPNQPFVHEDKPLEITPNEIFDPTKYEAYYNVCWFDCGTLFRCEHSYHSTPEHAQTCSRSNISGSFIGKILEEQ